MRILTLLIPMGMTGLDEMTEGAGVTKEGRTFVR